MSNIQIAVAYHKNSILIQNDCLLPIQVGRDCADNNLDMAGDNTGDNISTKNFWYAELTAIYWLWKNSDADIKGLFHYRRYLDLNTASEEKEETVYEYPTDKHFSASVFLKKLNISTENIEKLFQKYIILTRKKEDLREWSDYTVKTHYEAKHHGEHLKRALEIIKDDYPEYYPTALNLINGTTSYFTNMFIMKKEQYDEYCSWLFDILFKIEPEINLYDKSLAPCTPKARWAGFLGERLTAIYIQKQIDDGKKVGEFPAVILTTDGHQWMDCNTYDNHLYVRENISKVTIPNGNKPIISVCIAAYNVDKYIEKCVTSVMEQTLQNIEIIIVNDGSSDKTLEIISNLALKDTRIKIINQENIGAGYSRNKGISQAQGKYIHFLDGDDYIAPRFLEKMVQNAEKYHSDIVISNHICFKSSSGEELHRSTLPHTLVGGKLNVQNMPDLLLVPCHVWDKIYRYDLIKNVYFTRQANGEDIPFWYQAIITAKSVSILREPLYYYRMNMSSVQTKPEYILNCFENIKYAEAFIAQQSHIVQEYFELFKMVLIGHMMYRASAALNTNAKFRKVFYEKSKKLLNTHTTANFDDLKQQKEYFYCDFKLMEVVKNSKSLRQFEKIAKLYSGKRLLWTIIKNNIRKIFASEKNYEKYQRKINEAKEKLVYPLKFKFLGLTILKITRHNMKYKVKLCRIPVVKKDTFNKKSTYSFLGIPLLSQTEIKTKFLGITVNNKIDIFLQKQLNEIKRNIDKEIPHRFDFIEHQLSNVLPAHLEHLKKIVFTISQPNQSIIKITYQNGWEKEFLKKYYKDFVVASSKESVKGLLRGLPEQSAKNVEKIIGRIKQLRDNNFNDIDIFSEKEQQEILDADKSLKNIIMLQDNIYYHNGYFLPKNHFECVVFEQKLHIDDIPVPLKEKTDIIDVGAYIGDSALILNSLHPRKIWAFEANPKNCMLIEETLKLNNIDNVQPVNLALGDCKGQVILNDDDACSSITSVTVDSSITVQMDSLDNFVKANPSIKTGLIKVDIKGAEQNFLLGAKEVIKKHKPILMISIYHNWHDFISIKNIIESWNLGYKFIITEPAHGSIVLETSLIAYIEE